MKIATYVTDIQHEGYLRLKKSCPDIITLPPLEQSLGSGIIDKIKAMHKFASEQEPDEIIMFCDGYDVIIFGDSNEIERRFTFDFTCDILVNAEKALWTPDLDCLRYQYKSKKFQEGNWSYLNSGVYIGYADSIRDMLAIMLYMFEKKTETRDDQAAMNLVYLASKLDIEIDESCKILQCYSFIGDMDYVYGDGYILNNITGHKPLVFHGNGKTNMELVMKARFPSDNSAP